MGFKKLAALGLTTLLAIAVGLSTGNIFTDSDTTHYLRLAAGLPDFQPFASRQLAPLIVRALTHLGLPLHASFLLLGILSLVVFVGTVTYLLEQTNTPIWLRWSILGLYFWGMQFGELVLPDLFYAALLSGFLLLLRSRRHLGWAIAMMFPLMLARESTILMLLCWLYVGWRSLSRGKLAGSIAAVLAGAVVIGFLSASSGGNHEGLSPILYLIGKIPWNFARNFLGIEPWANVSQSCAIPAWHHAVALGPLHDIGYCRFDPQYPVRLIAYALGTFGLLPMLYLRVRKFQPPGLLTSFCLLYGGLSFLLAGLLGYSVQRLYGYGWPAFLVALPLLNKTGDFRTPRWAAAFVGLHLLSSWLEWRVDKLTLLAGELVVWTLGFFVLHYGWPREPERTPGRIQSLRNPRKML